MSKISLPGIAPTSRTPSVIVTFDPTEPLPTTLAWPAAAQGSRITLVVDAATDAKWSIAATIAIATEWAGAGRKAILADLHAGGSELPARLGAAVSPGVSDLLAGTPIAKCVRPLNEHPFLYMAPGASGDDVDAVLRHAHWAPLIEGLRRTGASLILFVPGHALDVPALAEHVDDVILLGGGAIASMIRSLLPTTLRRVVDVTPTSMRGSAAAAKQTPAASGTQRPAANAANVSADSRESAPRTLSEEPANAEPIVEVTELLAPAADDPAAAAEPPAAQPTAVAAASVELPPKKGGDADSRPATAAAVPGSVRTKRAELTHSLRQDDLPSDLPLLTPSPRPRVTAPESQAATPAVAPAVQPQAAEREPEPSASAPAEPAARTAGAAKAPRDDSRVAAAPAAKRPQRTTAAAGRVEKSPPAEQPRPAAPLPPREVDAEMVTSAMPPRKFRALRDNGEPNRLVRTGITVLGLLLFVALGIVVYSTQFSDPTDEVMVPVAASATVALPYSVELGSYDTFQDASAATVQLRRRFANITFFVSVDHPRYRVFGGLAPDAQTAEAVLDMLREAGVVTQQTISRGQAGIRHVPLAFDLGTHGSERATRSPASTFALQGIPTYVTAVEDGQGNTIWKLFAGAYSDSDNAAMLASIIESKGLEVSLLPRIGRDPRGGR
jgi:hypothetical protein